MGWNSIPKPKPTPPGIWEEYTYGMGYRSWLIRCPPAFQAHITQSGQTFYLQINNDGRGPHKTLEAAQIMAELAMVTAIREMLPVYKLLVDRLENRHRQNIIPMKPKD